MASLNNAEMGRARANSNDEVWEVPTNWVVEKGNVKSSRNQNIGAFSKLASFFPATNRPKTEANRVFSRPPPVNAPAPVPAAVDPTVAARPTALPPRTPLRTIRTQQVATPIPAKRPIEVVVHKRKNRKNGKNRTRKNRKNRKTSRKYRR